MRQEKNKYTSYIKQRDATEARTRMKAQPKTELNIWKTQNAKREMLVTNEIFYVKKVGDKN